jgi:transcriptional regulator with XRE-family HTH domain
MARRKLPRFEEWEAEKLQDPAFIAAAESLEPGYQVARLRLQRGLTQAQLAELVGTRQPSIARLENGNSAPSLSFLNKIAAVLNAKIEVRFVAETKPPYGANKDTPE